MESRSGIIAVFLLVAASCGGESESSLFGTPADSGEGGEGSGGSSAGRGEQSSGGSASAGRAGSSGKGGSSGATGSAGNGGESGSAGSARAGEAGESGAETGGAGGSGASGGSGATSAAGGSDPSGGRPSGGQGGLGTGGRNEADCDELAAAYAEALAEAQACNPNVDANECTAQVASDLGCGCPTFVNPSHEEAIATLQGLSQKAVRVCPIVVCPAIACVLPEVGTCSSSGSGKGHCVAGPIDK